MEMPDDRVPAGRRGGAAPRARPRAQRRGHPGRHARMDRAATLHMARGLAPRRHTLVGQFPLVRGKGRARGPAAWDHACCAKCPAASGSHRPDSPLPGARGAGHRSCDTWRREAAWNFPRGVLLPDPRSGCVRLGRTIRETVIPPGRCHRSGVNGGGREATFRHRPPGPARNLPRRSQVGTRIRLPIRPAKPPIKKGPSGVERPSGGFLFYLRAVRRRRRPCRPTRPDTPLPGSTPPA